MGSNRSPKARESAVAPRRQDGLGVGVDECHDASSTPGTRQFCSQSSRFSGSMDRLFELRSRQHQACEQHLVQIEQLPERDLVPLFDTAPAILDHRSDDAERTIDKGWALLPQPGQCLHHLARAGGGTSHRDGQVEGRCKADRLRAAGAGEVDAAPVGGRRGIDARRIGVEDPLPGGDRAVDAAVSPLRPYRVIFRVRLVVDEVDNGCYALMRVRSHLPKRRNVGVSV